MLYIVVVKMVMYLNISKIHHRQKSSGQFFSSHQRSSAAAAGPGPTDFCLHVREGLFLGRIAETRFYCDEIWRAG